MILKILMALAAGFGIYWAVKVKKTWPTIITLGMTVGILLIFLPSETIQTYSFYVYMAFAALAFLYGVAVKGKNIKERLFICLMSASIFVYWLWVLKHWHGNTLLLPIFTLLVLLVGMLTKVKVRNEFSFLIILTADAIVILLEQLMKAY